MPKLGAARTPYSRTCKPGPANMGALPDPEAIYEAVMARDGFKKNPNNVSSILWYWATIVIHGMSRLATRFAIVTDHQNRLILDQLEGPQPKRLFLLSGPFSSVRQQQRSMRLD